MRKKLSWIKVAGVPTRPGFSVRKNPFLNKMHRWARPRKKDNPEGRLVHAILYYLRLKGHTAGKTKTMGSYHKAEGMFLRDPQLFTGFPDITAFCPHLVFIEAKSEEGKQSNSQKAFQKLCDDSGTPYILARSLEDVEKIIK